MINCVSNSKAEPKLIDKKCAKSFSDFRAPIPQQYLTVSKRLPGITGLKFQIYVHSETSELVDKCPGITPRSQSKF